MQSTKPTTTALITGGAKRIGAAIARELHQCGLNIVIHYRQSQQSAERLAAELNTARANSCAALHSELRDSEDCQQLVQKASAQWGNLSCLVNNASSFYATPLSDITEQDWQTIMHSNAKAPLFLAQAAVPALTESQGSICNIADIHVAQPRKQYSVYTMAKAALISLTRSLALELAPTIRVNAVAPGAILWPEQEGDESAQETVLQSIALRRLGKPTDIAQAVRFLTLEADYITGQIINIDGGKSLHS